jgi:predicted nuclease with TOPRIM domain
MDSITKIAEGMASEYAEMLAMARLAQQGEGLPQYMEEALRTLIGRIEELPVQLKNAVERVTNNLPKDAIEKENQPQSMQLPI